MKSQPAFPYTFINVAMTADGKIAPSNRQFVPFGSKRDHALLLQIRATADAVMSGARTIDTFPVTMGPGGKRYQNVRLKRGLAENNLRIIVSGSASINPNAEIFNHHFSPIIVLTTEKAPKAQLKKLKDLGAITRICGEKEIDFEEALAWLTSAWKVKRLLCEGGGELNNALLKANLVQEIYVTICPLIFGGRNSPTLADGQGVERLAQAKRLELKRMKQVGNELFLRYEVLTNS